MFGIASTQIVCHNDMNPWFETDPAPTCGHLESKPMTGNFLSVFVSLSFPPLSV